mmetsp:Transcript_5377/g.4066  ORF Transcript_5377/g.4066 Transcript_5377/m.4066 type:complete len:106 (-) Transcript_5377:8-325(-)
MIFYFTKCSLSGSYTSPYSTEISISSITYAVSNICALIFGFAFATSIFKFTPNIGFTSLTLVCRLTEGDKVLIDNALVFLLIGCTSMELFSALLGRLDLTGDLFS